MKMIGILILFTLSGSTVIPARERSVAVDTMLANDSPYVLDTLTAVSEMYRYAPDLKIYFMYPNEKLKRREIRPAIVFFFGGGWNFGTIQTFASQGRRLADRGMIVALVDYSTEHLLKLVWRMPSLP